MSLIHDGTGATRTISQQALAPATITGYDARYFYRYAVSAAGTGNTYQRFGTKIENVQNLTGTVTVSFWAKADSSRTVSFQLDQYYGSGGSSATVGLQLSGMAAVTTSWQRFSATGTLASISGKTIGDGSYVYAYFAFPANTTLTIDIAGFQIEQGSVATGFTRAAGTIQGELAACQRYFYLVASGTGQLIANGFYVLTTQFNSVVVLPVTMRSTPTLSVVTGTNYYDTYNGANDFLDTLSIFGAGTKVSGIFNNTEASGTQYRPAYLETNNAAAFVAFSAEL
jgi:hypothetical protein